MILFILKALLLISMALTVVTLGLGILSMRKGGTEGTLKSNRMMQLRVLFQAVAVIVFSLLLFLNTH